MNKEDESIEAGLEKLRKLTDLIANKNTSIDASMQALRKTTQLSKHLREQLKGYELSLQEISEEIEEELNENSKQ